MRRLVATLLFVAVCAPVAPAGAAYEVGAQLVSASPERREQGDADTTRLDISGDGRFVVFDTRARNFFADNDPEPPDAVRIGGVFRRDLVTGALELVAYGDLQSTTGGSTRFGAHNPSISGDGRWVAFSTAAQLSPVDSNVNVDSYVRDMTRPIGDPAAYELVSARDGDDGPATYTTSGSFGSEPTTGSSISADGRMIVFRTRAVSDLPDREPGATGSGQIFVRDRELRRTVLVTQSMLDGGPAGGALSSPVAISADGTTVVWSGANADLQTSFFPAEFAGLNYYLWRRIADGPSAPTRRITGVVDSDDPGCPPGSPVDPNDQTSLGPCYGPLTLPEDKPDGTIAGQLPALSANGRRVAFLAGPGLRPDPVSGTMRDLFVTDMSAHVTRKAGTLQLTRESGASDVPIEAIAVSADGGKIAFVTGRIVFALPSPRLTTPPPVRDGTVAELYVLDLSTMEIERVLRGYDGESIDRSVSGNVGALAMSDDATRIAFVAGASNLFFGDSNSVPDAFVLSEVDPNADAGRAAGEPPFPEIGPPAERSARSTPTLRLRVRRRGSSLRLTVRVPGAGGISARARGRVRPSKKLSTVASSRERATRAGTKTFTVRPARRYRGALRRQGVIRTRLVVTFTPTGGGAPITARRTVSLRG